MKLAEFQNITGQHPSDIVGEDWENIISEWNAGSIKIKG